MHDDTPSEQDHFDPDAHAEEAPAWLARLWPVLPLLALAGLVLALLKI